MAYDFSRNFGPARTEQYARVCRDSAVARVRAEHGPLLDQVPDDQLDRHASELIDLGIRLALEQFTAMVRMELNVIDAAEKLRFEAAMLRPARPIFMGMDLARAETKIDTEEQN